MDSEVLFEERSLVGQILHQKQEEIERKSQFTEIEINLANAKIRKD